MCPRIGQGGIFGKLIVPPPLSKRGYKQKPAGDRIILTNLL